MTLFYSAFRIRKSITLEKEELFGLFDNNQRLISNADLDRLPAKLKSYLIKAGVIGSFRESNVSFTQKGQIKTAQNKKWRHFKAKQYMSSRLPGFIWSATSFPLFIRDKSFEGVGEVKINLLGYKNLATFHGQKINESALVRYLGELMFFPIGFLSKDIEWENNSKGSLKARLKVRNVVAEGVFYFNDDGLLHQFKSRRYMGETQESFTGIAEDYTMMAGMYLPSKMKAIWNLNNGDFEYFIAQITDYRID